MPSMSGHMCGSSSSISYKHTQTHTLQWQQRQRGDSVFEESSVPISGSLISPWVWGSTRLETKFTYKSGLNPAGQVIRSFKMNFSGLFSDCYLGTDLVYIWRCDHIVGKIIHQIISSGCIQEKKNKLVEKSEVDRNHWLAKYSEWNVSLYEINDSGLLWAVLIFFHFVGFQDIESTPTIYSCLHWWTTFFFPFRVT